MWGKVHFAALCVLAASFARGATVMRPKPSTIPISTVKLPSLRSRDGALGPPNGSPVEDPRDSMKPIVVGIAGGTGSGKTTLAEAIVRELGADEVLHLRHDNFYKDLSHLAVEERAMTNFDHPDSLETDMLVNQLRCLRDGAAVEVPTYDFTTHTRTAETLVCGPRPVIIVEGILLFHDPSLRDLLDLKIFVDAEADTRFIRRLRRDVQERGRDTESVCEQYTKSVRPMHLQYVEPSKVFADLLVPNEGHGKFNAAAIDMVVSGLQKFAQQLAKRPAE